MKNLRRIITLTIIFIISMNQIAVLASPVEQEIEEGEASNRYIVDIQNDKDYQEIQEEYKEAVSEEQTKELEDNTIILLDSDGVTEKEVDDIQDKYEEITLEPDYIMEAASLTEEDLSEACEDNEYEWNLQMIHAEQYENIQPVKVAVIDSGIDYSEELNVVGRVNLVDDYAVSPLYEDITGHGTGIAGIIAAKEDGYGIKGINPYCELYSIKVLDEYNKAPMSRVIQAIYWCIENDIDIINMSFGMPQYSEILHKAVQDAEEAGILMIAAAGNNENKTYYPAAYEEVMSVGSVNSKGEISSFNGKGVEIVAPGEKIKTTSFYQGTMVFGGTSIATAHVTGVASVLWGMYPNQSVRFIRQLMDACVCKNEEMKSKGIGMVDLSYSIQSYDDFCSIYYKDKNYSVSDNCLLKNEVQRMNVVSGNTVSQNDTLKTNEMDMIQNDTVDSAISNDNQIQTFEEPEYVEGLWNSVETHQKDADNFGNSVLNLTSDEIKVFRECAKMPDTSSSIYNIASLNGGGNANYVASLRYLFLVSVKVKNGQTVDSAKEAVSFIDKYTNNAGRVKNAVTDVTNKTIAGVPNSNKINSLKILGLAFHQIGDIFAHQTVIPKGSANLSIYAGEEHEAVRTAIMTGKLTVRELKTIDSFYSPDNYEDNVTFMSKRYTVATVSAEKAMLQGYAQGTNFLIKWLMPEVLTGNTDYNLKLLNLRTFAKQSVSQQEDNYSDEIWKECSVEK